MKIRKTGFDLGESKGVVFYNESTKKRGGMFNENLGNRRFSRDV